MNSLGNNIRRIRKEKNISIRELSEKTKLSSSFISQVERDLVSPSIASLKEIARVLDVPLFFLIESGNLGVVVKKSERRKFTMPGSKVVFELLTPDLNRKMEMVLITLGKGEQTFNKPYGHEGDEVVFCMKGTFEVSLGVETYVLEEGDSMYFNCNIPHKFKNIGDGQGVILSCTTPPSF